MANVAPSKLEKQSLLAGPGIPDAKYMRNRIPIQDVARKLRLEVNGRQAHCWRIEAHRNGDSNPSIWFDRNNRGRCHVCDARGWSNIDLVMMIQRLNTADAIRWIAQRFEVPRLPKGKHLVEQRRWKAEFRVGTRGDIMEDFVRSGLLAELGLPVIAVVAVLLTFADHNGRVEISYRGIMQYAGIGSEHTVRRALLRLQKLHLLENLSGRNGGLRACGVYQFTPDDPTFLAHAHERHEQHRELVEVQRAARGAQRKERAAEQHPIPKSILSAPSAVRGNFTLHSSAASNCARKDRKV
jgi:hypothetical protein